MRRLERCSAAVCLCVCMGASFGATVAHALAATERPGVVPHLHVNFEQMRLKNGLRVILVEDHRAPIVSLVLTYDVGSANERPGHTGFAHLFEHLMFQGSQNVAPGDHGRLIGNCGGLSDATTANDSTIYLEKVPANQLDLILFLEADRLRSLKISQDNFVREREVVKEERRLRIDNQPYGKSGQVLNELLYDNFAYAHDGMGSMADLDAATLEDIKGFFDTYYAVNNATLVLAGDFDTKMALDKIEQYFGELPARPRPPPVDRTEPPRRAERRQTVADALAPLPQIEIAFKAVPADHPDFFALQVLSAVLNEGHSARLYEALVERELATGVNAYVYQQRGPGAFYISAIPRSERTITTAEATVYEQLARLQKKPIDDWELEKAQNSLAAAHVRTLQQGLMRALLIGRYTVDFNDPNRINTYLDRIAAVTKQDVQRVARTYLRKGSRIVVMTLPAKTPEQSR